MSASPGLRRAKRMLHKRCVSHDWYSGVGIVPASSGLGLRVTVNRKPDGGAVPETYYGYDVEVVVIGGYTARDDS
ncbi:MAG: hypothetical protein AB8G18_02405 [Gammaproteobacteria bacterium]